MEGHTRDGRFMTTIEQWGEHDGQDIGNLWVQSPMVPDGWSVYPCMDRLMQLVFFNRACGLTAAEFHKWWEQGTRKLQSRLDES